MEHQQDPDIKKQIALAEAKVQQILEIPKIIAKDHSRIKAANAVRGIIEAEEVANDSLLAHNELMEEYHESAIREIKALVEQNDAKRLPKLTTGEVVDHLSPTRYSNFIVNDERRNRPDPDVYR